MGGRVWYGEQRLWDEAEAGVAFEFENGVRKRWGVEIVLVGEMKFGVVPGFEKGIGGLAVNVSLGFLFPFLSLVPSLSRADFSSSFPSFSLEICSTASTSDFP